MPANTARRVLLTAALAGVASLAQAADVLVFSSGDGEVDAAAVGLLESAGHDVTVGVQIWELTGTEDLSAHDSILALCGPNWYQIYSNFTEPAQQLIADYANAGGGIVFSEWIGYSTQFGAALPEILPTTYQYYATNESITLNRASAPGADGTTVTCQMPQSVSAPADDFSGTESVLVAKPGATVFFDSETAGGAGVAGWNVGSGRVLQFSSTIGPNLLTDFTFSRLVLNAIEWTTETEPCAADIVRDGLLDLSDVTAFVTAFTGGCE